MLYLNALFRLLLLAILRKLFSFPQLIHLTQGGRAFQKPLRERDIEALYFFLRRIVKRVHLGPECLLVSLTLFWLSHQNSKICFSEEKISDRNHKAHAWFEFEGKLYTTNMNSNHNSLVCYEKL